MLTDNRVFVKAGAAATIGAAALMFIVSNGTGAEQFAGAHKDDPHQLYLRDSFAPSTANDVSISNYSSAEMDEFVAMVDDVYASLAAKQDRLDSHMEKVIADSLWDLYVTD